MNGTDLLADFRSTRSEGAFSELVRRYANLVYSVAKRRLSNGSLAEEVTQVVFTRFAHAAPNLRADAELVGWLHRTTVHVAIDVWRSETRRRTREQHAAVMEPASNESSQIWDEIAPSLDEALNQLRDADRQAVLLRFFERKPMRDVGRILGVSEDAAKMRVSRAIDRLRTQLAARGITCSVVALGTILFERSVEAAPLNLVSLLIRNIKLPVSAGAAGKGGIHAALTHTSRVKVITGVALCLGICVIAILRWFVAPPRNGTIKPTSGNPPYARLKTSQVNDASSGRSSVAVIPRLQLQVVDAETGVGLAEAKVRAVYFYAGGRGEAHELSTDGSGNVAIPEPSEAADRFANIFVSAEGHVPKCLSGGRRDAAQYTMKLDRALSVGGVIINQQGQAVEDVKIRVQGPGVQDGASENIDFQTSEVTSDAVGRWLCSYIPRDWSEIRFILTHPQYAVTLPIVRVGKVDLTKLVLVIDRGHTVTGRVLDIAGQPIAGATIKELNNTGYRRQSTETDADGTFTLEGLLPEYEFWQQLPDETNTDGTLRLRGMTGQGETRGVRVLAQANRFAPLTRTVQLLEPLTKVDFTLAQGNIFRGRVLDDAGNTITDAVVRTEADEHGLDRYKWQTRTDAEGRFEWDSAPEEPVLFWFEAEGYNWLRDIPLMADGSEHEIKLTRRAAE